MTFNLRYPSVEDGVNIFWNRTGRIKRVILTENPDLIGFQEVTDEMRDWLCDALDGYSFFGCGRNENCHGESMLLGCRRNVFELISLENKWLSLTPDVPGSLYGEDQSSCPRMFTAATLKGDGIANPFVFINTHLDHHGPKARLWEAKALLAYIARRAEDGTRIILTGDFNAAPQTDEMRLFTAPCTELTDCTASIGQTFHGFGLYPGDAASDATCDVTSDATVSEADSPFKIDYIFTNAPSRAARVIPDTHPGGLYYSDHYAVCVSVTL